MWKTRILIYLAGFLASSLSIAGFYDFDIVTGLVTPRPFNLYDFMGSAAGFVSSGLASVALLKGWNRK